MKIRFPVYEIEFWASLYPIEREGDKLAEVIGQDAKKLGYLTRPQFLSLCYWKTPRTKHLVEANSSDWIKYKTGLAFLPRLGLEAPADLLRDLRGVGLPTASAILHFCHVEPFPVIDYRALWSLGVDKYTDTLWMQYIVYTRKLAREAGVSMRTLDRALWQYSREHQPVSDITRSHNGR